MILSWAFVILILIPSGVLAVHDFENEYQNNEILENNIKIIDTRKNNTIKNSLYIPVNGYIVTKSPVYKSIIK